MTHDEAKKSMAAEGYILDDLEPAERDAFEEHFADCTDCTADVLDAAAVADGLRPKATNVVPFRPRHYPQWAAAAAVVAVSIGLTYQYAPQIAGLWSHHSKPPIQAAHATAGEQLIVLDTVRAPETPYVIVGAQSVAFDFVIPVAEPRPPYLCELRDDAGVILGSTTVKTKDEAANPVSLVIPAGKFHQGKANYTLGIRGGGPETPAAYHFAVEVR